MEGVVAGDAYRRCSRPVTEGGRTSAWVVEYNRGGAVLQFIVSSPPIRFQLVRNPHVSISPQGPVPSTAKNSPRQGDGDVVYYKVVSLATKSRQFPSRHCGVTAATHRNGQTPRCSCGVCARSSHQPSRRTCRLQQAASWCTMDPRLKLQTPIYQ